MGYDVGLGDGIFVGEPVGVDVDGWSVGRPVG